jgi:hypothetical protein
MSKTTKYYTIKECFDACRNDDIPYIDGGFNHMTSLTKSELLEKEEFTAPMASLKQQLSDRWQIKRAEPKVLTPDEWLRDQYPGKYSGKYIQTNGYHDTCMHFAFESGEKQGIRKGRIERDQDLRRALELAREVKNLYWNDNIHALESKLDELGEELNNLKPLYEQSNY